MTEIIDQGINQSNIRNKRSKLINSIIIGVIIGIDLITIATLINAKANLESKFLPDYTIYYMNASLIHFALIQSTGVIPGLFLRARKNYFFSTYCLLAFFLAGIIFKDMVHLHKFFF